MKHGAQRRGVRGRLGRLVPGALLMLALAPYLSAQSSAEVPAKRDRPDGMGYHIARLNDVDGDKCADFAIDDGIHIAWVISGSTGTVLARDEGFSGCVATFGGDVDGDGAWDILTWRRCVAPVLELRSGKDLHVVRTLAAPKGMTQLWSSTVCAGDWDADGTPDVAFGGYSDRQGTLVVVSGRTGELLHEVPGTHDLLQCTQLVWKDLDHDGRPDFISATEPWQPGARSWFVHVQFATTGSTVLTIPSESIYDGFAAGLAAVPDVDGDGWSDILVVHAMSGVFDAQDQARFNDAETMRGIAGKAVIFSSWTGQPVRTLATSYADAMCEGVTIANLDDLDGDGVPEFAVSYDRYWALGRVVVHSGKSGKVLREHEGVEGTGPTATLSDVGRFAVAVVALGDTDGDGVGDYAIGASGGVDGMGPGCVSIYSGKTGALLHSLWKRDLVKGQK